ncbi:MAG: hypothetical protein R3B54_18550 [Bdellovibrionota bacterium]
MEPPRAAQPFLRQKIRKHRFHDLPFGEIDAVGAVTGVDEIFLVSAGAQASTQEAS